MKITAIKQQAKRLGRFSVFVDDDYAFSLSDEALLESKLVVGQEMTAEEMGKCRQLSDADKLYGNTLRFTALRPHSVWEVEQYLKRNQASPALITIILNKLSKLHMIDDALFAKRWVENRRLLKSSSMRRVTAELRAKHVAAEHIEQALQADESDERTVLRTMAEKKLSLSRFRQDKLKLMQYLSRQGFSYDDIKSVVDDLYAKLQSEL